MKKGSRLVWCMALAASVAAMGILSGYLCLDQKRMEEDYSEYVKWAEGRVEEKRIEEAARLEEEERIRQEEEAKKRRVLVETLPVYAYEDIRKNREEGPKTNGAEEVRLKYGDIVKVIDEKYPYMLVQISESVSGFVWSDCIGKVEEDAVEQRVIVIDAGYQRHENPEEEKRSPDSDQTVARMPDGGVGVTTGREAHELTLEMALLLEQELEKRGYMVVQTRRGADVDISRAERAELANQIDADVLVGLYVASADTSDKKGRKINYAVSGESEVRDAKSVRDALLAQALAAAFAQAEEAEQVETAEAAKNAELNWCEAPAVVFYMGYLSNGEDDMAPNDAAVQNRMAEGIADGLDNYFMMLQLENP